MGVWDAWDEWDAETLGRGRFSKKSPTQVRGCVCVCVCVGAWEGGRRVSKSVRTRRDGRLFPSSTGSSLFLDLAGGCDSRFQLRAVSSGRGGIVALRREEVVETAQPGLT